MRNRFKIGSISGIDIQIDWSLIIIFSLITVSLGAGVLPVWHPDWASLLIWLTAFMAAVFFFVSILLHELSHAVVGRRFGGKIPRITLFVFGGMAEMESEPATWKAEFWMAIVGPVVSVLIGFACIGIAVLIAGLDETQMAQPQQMLAQLGPVTTVLFWLGPVNIILGLFNMVPGYPLDGGRVLRAVIWGITGNLHKATRWATGAGQFFAWLLIVSGLSMIMGARLPLFGTGLIPGLWLAFIGWFLNSAAVTSYQQLRLKQSLNGASVRDIMQLTFTPVSPDTSLQGFVTDYLLRSDQRAFPVTHGGSFLGLICLDDVRRANQEQRTTGTVGDLMTPKERLITVAPSEEASDAVSKLARANINQLPVIENNQLVGLVTREQVVRWLTLERSGSG